MSATAKREVACYITCAVSTGGRRACAKGATYLTLATAVQAFAHPRYRLIADLKG
jgi:hypothetical protein